MFNFPLYNNRVVTEVVLPFFTLKFNFFNRVTNYVQS